MPLRHSARKLPILSVALGAWLTGCQDTQVVEVKSPSASVGRSYLASCRAGGGSLAQMVPEYALSRQSLFAASHDASPSASTVSNVHGAGGAAVTDENGYTYTARVAISALLDPDGGTHGSVNFVFDQDFSEFWGAEPGVHAIHVVGKVASMTAANGAITLAGTAIETDIAPGRRPLVFPNEPFEIVISSPNQFTLQWCALPVFDLEMRTGSFAY
jgi:hypothetical protein